MIEGMSNSRLFEQDKQLEKRKWINAINEELEKLEPKELGKVFSMIRTKIIAGL